MAKPYSPTTVASYDLQFAKAIAKLKGGMANVLKKTAEGCLMNIIQGPPLPYLTGSYMSSHRVGINEPDTSDTVIHKKGVRGIEQAQGRALAEVRKLKNVKGGDTIYISNSVGYSSQYGYSWARNVEYVGWSSEKGGRTEPYLVYEKAVAKIPDDILKHVSEIKTTLETE
jgi:hypothetical protein